jgi:hypothetical protein
MNRCLLAALATSAIACSSPRAVVRFDDDYEAARRASATSKLPLVVEVWAPW